MSLLFAQSNSTNACEQSRIALRDWCVLRFARANTRAMEVARVSALVSTPHRRALLSHHPYKEERFASVELDLAGRRALTPTGTVGMPGEVGVIQHPHQQGTPEWNTGRSGRSTAKRVVKRRLALEASTYTSGASACPAPAGDPGSARSTD